MDIGWLGMHRINRAFSNAVLIFSVRLGIYGMEHFGCSWAILGNSAESVDSHHLRKAELKGSKRCVGGHQL